MNSLSVDFFSSEFSPSYELEMFELLVDGKPMAAWLMDTNDGIPLWLVEDGLPMWRPHDPHPDPNLRIVTVCGCGEYGCGHSRCTVHIEDATVVFDDFQGNVSAAARAIRFVFPLTEYEAVLRQVNEAKARDATWTLSDLR